MSNIRLMDIGNDIDDSDPVNVMLSRLQVN